MAIPRFQIYLGLFFLLFASNTVFCHWLAQGFIATAQEVRWAEEAGLDPAEAVGVEEEQLSRGGLLILTNLPLFGGLGWIVRGENPGTGPFYWVLLVAGSAYVPLFLTACVYLLFNAPKGPGHFPGLDPAGVSDDDDEEEDDGDDTRST